MNVSWFQQLISRKTCIVFCHIWDDNIPPHPHSTGMLGGYIGTSSRDDNLLLHSSGNCVSILF